MSTIIDEKTLADYEALCAHPALTPGPLTANRGSILPSEEIQKSRIEDNLDCLIGVCYGKNAQTDADAAFFASSRTMGPLLAAKVRELETDRIATRDILIKAYAMMRAGDEGGVEQVLADEVARLVNIGPVPAAKSTTIEADGIHLAVMLDELAKDPLFVLDEDTRAAVDRLLAPIAGKRWRQESPEAIDSSGEDASLPVNSIGTCARCGYPGPRHCCTNLPTPTGSGS